MKEIVVSPKKLKEIIEEGVYLGEGFYGSVFEYEKEVIKLDKELYYLIKNHSMQDSKFYVNYYYGNEKSDFSDLKQLQILEEKQKNVFLTKFPYGIIRIKDINKDISKVISGEILPNFKDHHDLATLLKDDYSKILIILRNLLEAVKELEQNEIAQEDMYHLKSYNVLYKGYIPQIIDMSGINVKCGNKYRDAKSMYIELGHIIIDFFEYNNLPCLYRRWYTDTFEKNNDLLIDLQEKVKKLK